MTDCREHQERLDALLDGELDAAGRAALLGHVAACPACAEARDELERARAALRRAFDRTRAAAPPPPAALRPPPRKRRAALLVAGGLAAAAAIVLALATPRARLDASPAAVIQRAAERYGKFTDVELWVRFDSQAAELLRRVFGAKQETPAAAEEVQRVLIRSPHYLLLQKTPDPRGPWRTDRPLEGFDGAQAWKYDPEKREVRFDPPEGLSLKVEGAEGSDDLLRFLSWGFVRDLEKLQRECTLAEATGPSDERAGRRVFRLDPRPPQDGDRRWFWSSAVLTIDPGRDLIEKMVLDVTLAAVSLLRIHVEVAEVDQGVSPRFFSPRHHVPD
jgi:hypothetical protein